MLLDSEVLVLIALTIEARLLAYAPYSKYLVGAAVVTEDDRVYFGVNVENASYGLALCAERSAISSAIVGGASRLKAVIVVTESEIPGTPCGACRQWMAEFADDTLPVIVANTTGFHKTYTLGQLLPEAFRL